ncbi:MAG: hypothetical protein GEV03_19040 [Streptosporangiales bacterium]|nr:hypothetical protein [Streptosporangiales bacterium]
MAAGAAPRPADRAGWTEVWMDTLVTIQLAVPAADAPAWAGPVARAFRWFAAVEAACSRFDPTSEVSQLTHQVGHRRAEVERPARADPAEYRLPGAGSRTVDHPPR